MSDSDNFPKIRENFPFKTPRPGQLEVISKILNAIDEGYKYIILEAGTGTGKSAIATTLSSMADESYILTLTKQLQDQYLRDFNNLKIVKGRSNFKCRHYKDTPCSEGKCITQDYNCRYSLKNRTNKITKQNTCPYYYQKFQALNAKSVISNYHYLFLELNYVGDFQKRNLLICDEAHNLESMLMGQLTLEFFRDDLKDYLKFDLTEEIIDELNQHNYSHWISFIGQIKDEYELELEKLESLQKDHLAEKIAFIKHQINGCNRFLANILNDPKSWIFNWDDNLEVAQFKPLKVDHYAKDTLFKYADVTLFMSATILDSKLFAKWLGINEDEISTVTYKSPFDVKNNPIITYDGYNLSRAYVNVTAPRTIKTIREILDRHCLEKGIIHTVSGQCRDFLMDNLNNQRLITHDSHDRAQRLDEFINSKHPAVLVSPSMAEGVDLPGDLCRFQIIYKLPFPDWGDKQIRMRTNIDSEWYDYKTCLNLLQSHGRGMRYDGDYCTTYIIDSRFNSYIRKPLPDKFLPEEFKMAIEGYSQELKEKANLIKIGEDYLQKGDYERAIIFYRSLLKNKLFQNDDYPYLTLSEIYGKCELYEQEVQVILKFLNSGIKSDNEDYFKYRLKALEDKGYFNHMY